MVDFKELIAGQIYDESLGLSTDDIKEMIEIPGDSSLGDYAFPCFKLAKTMKKAPQLIAKDIAERMSASGEFARVEQVNAYVNIFIKREQLVSEVLGEVLTKGKDYGSSNVGEGKTVLIDFSSPNIAKPFHIGHIRSTVIGNSLYKLYDKLGYDVVRINHLGDYGTQFGKLIVAYKEWGDKAEVDADPINTLLKYYTEFHQKAEAHPELNEMARKEFLKLENKEPEELELWEKFRELSLKEFMRVYDMLGIEFDSYAGESFYSDMLPDVIKELDDDGLLQESQGAKIVDLEEYGMPPAIIAKSDGASLYATRDIATAIYRKKKYDFYKCIYVVASQQNLHFKQWKQVLELMGDDWEKDCVHVPFGLVSLKEGTMSTRSGRVVFLEDVLKEAVSKTKEIIKEKNPEGLDIDKVALQVGIGAVIFQELSNNRIKDYVFDWDKVLNFDGETGPYVQYTHARCASVLRKVSDEDLAKVANGQYDCSNLTSDEEYELIKLIYRVPDVILDAAEKYEPSILTRHIIDIAQSFNKFYHDERILVDNEDERVAKVALVQATKTVLACTLDLLGIAAPERM